MSNEHHVRNVLVAFFLAVLGMAIMVAVSQLSRKHAPEAPAAPVVTASSPDDVGWVLARIQACDRVCGPVPFEVEATVTSFRCTCGRPGNVGRAKVPSPRQAGPAGDAALAEVRQ